MSWPMRMQLCGSDVAYALDSCFRDNIFWKHMRLRKSWDCAGGLQWFCHNYDVQIGRLQERLRESPVSGKDTYEVLKSELARRDDTIQRLRKEVLSSQERRDAFQAEVSFNVVHFQSWVMKTVVIKSWLPSEILTEKD